MSDSQSVGSRVVEMRTSGEYGPVGSATRARHDELQRQLEEMPTVKLEVELADVRARLAAVHPASDVEEVAGLIVREMALVRICATTDAAVAQIHAQHAGLRETYAHDRRRAFGLEQDAKRNRARMLSRLEEIDGLLANPIPDRVSPASLIAHQQPSTSGHAVSIGVAMARQIKEWEQERTSLRVALGLETDDDDE